jgi:DNA-binding transcriptional MerR regulator
VTLIVAGAAATFLTSNQAGTTALILLGGLLAFIAITKRVPLLLEVGSTKIDSTYDDVFEAGRESVSGQDSGNDLAHAVEDPPAADIVSRFTTRPNGYRGAVAARASGITYRQLDYWNRTQLIEPSLTTASIAESRSLYSFADVVLLRTIKALLDSSLSLQAIRGLIEALKSRQSRELPSLVAILQDGEWAIEDEAEFARKNPKFVEPAMVVPIRPIALSVVTALTRLTDERNAGQFPSGD